MSLVRFRSEAPFADLAHLVERDLAKVEVAGSSPVIRSTNSRRSAAGVSFSKRISGLVVQLVRTLACHARGQGFEPPSGRHFAAIAQSVERILGKDEVPSSNLGSSSMKKASFVRRTNDAFFNDIRSEPERMIYPAGMISASRMIYAYGAWRNGDHIMQTL